MLRRLDAGRYVVETDKFSAFVVEQFFRTPAEHRVPCFVDRPDRSVGLYNQLQVSRLLPGAVPFARAGLHPVLQRLVELLDRNLAQFAFGDVDRRAGEAHRHAFGIAHELSARQNPSHRAVGLDDSIFVAKLVLACEGPVEFGLERRQIVRMEALDVFGQRRSALCPIRIDGVNTREIRIAINDTRNQIPVPDADHAGRAECQIQPFLALGELFLDGASSCDIASHGNHLGGLAFGRKDRRNHEIPPLGRVLQCWRKAFEAAGAAADGVIHRFTRTRTVAVLPSVEPRFA